MTPYTDLGRLTWLVNSLRSAPLLTSPWPLFPFGFPVDIISHYRQVDREISSLYKRYVTLPLLTNL